ERLGRVPPDVVGVLVSLSGFSKPAVDEVLQTRSRPVLLLGPGELAELAEERADLREMLEDKLGALKIDGVVQLHEPAVPIGRRAAVSNGPAYLMSTEGERLEWLSYRGGFGPLCFAREDLEPALSRFGLTSVVLHIPHTPV